MKTPHAPRLLCPLLCLALAASGCRVQQMESDPTARSAPAASPTPPAPPVALPPLLPDSRPPVRSIPGEPAPAAVTVDSLIERLAGLKKQRSEIEASEAKVAALLREKLCEQRRRLDAIGVNEEGARPPGVPGSGTAGARVPLGSPRPAAAQNDPPRP